MKAAELRERTTEELVDELEASKRELFNRRFQWQTEETANPAQYGKLRTDIARILTVLKERKLGVNADIDSHSSGGDAAHEAPAAAPQA